MYTRSDLAPPIRDEVIPLLQARLADAVDLFTQIKQAHWNVKGPSFIALHELFDQAAEIVEEHGDLIAERITALGGRADGTVRVAASSSSLAELPARRHNVVAARRRHQPCAFRQDRALASIRQLSSVMPTPQMSSRRSRERWTNSCGSLRHTSRPITDRPTRDRAHMLA
jgi:DNA-binding ferritin-like protein